MKLKVYYAQRRNKLSLLTTYAVRYGGTIQILRADYAKKKTKQYTILYRVVVCYAVRNTYIDTTKLLSTYTGISYAIMISKLLNRG